jgi:NifB/MoaA-like Fe-S oxidoreductase
MRDGRCEDKSNCNGGVHPPANSPLEGWQPQADGVENVGRSALDAPSLRTGWKKGFTLITGASFYPILCTAAEKISRNLNILLNVVKIENTFFGDTVTVAGLITGQDILAAKDRIYSDIIIPSNMLREFEDVFLDGMTVEELSQKLGRRVMVCPPTGEGLIEVLLEN